MTTTTVDVHHQIRKATSILIPANATKLSADERGELLNGALRSLDGSTLASGAQIRAAAGLLRHLTARV